MEVELNCAAAENQTSPESQRIEATGGNPSADEEESTERPRFRTTRKTRFEGAQKLRAMQKQYRRLFRVRNRLVFPTSPPPRALSFLPAHMAAAIEETALKGQITERDLLELPPKAQWSRVAALIDTASQQFVERSPKKRAGKSPGAPSAKRKAGRVCFACRIADGTALIRCARNSACKRFYHKECLMAFPGTVEEKDKLVCPVHICALCGSAKGTMTECVDCPLAYHSQCLPAGCLPIGERTVICFHHYASAAAAAKKKMPKPFSINYCIECGAGGDLLCCDECPAAVHEACIDREEYKPKKTGEDVEWRCEDCLRGLKPLPGDVVWAKYGGCKWWPAVVCAMDDVPEGVKATNPNPIPGEIVVKFFGHPTHGWVSLSRVLSFAEKDRIVKFYNLKTGSGSAQLQNGIRLATEAHEKNVFRHDSIVRESRESASFTLIETNTPARGVKLSDYFCPEENTASQSLCSCSSLGDRSDISPCGSDSNCINRITHMECNDANCSVDPSKCCNRFVTRLEYVKVERVGTVGRGFGLKALEDIPPGKFVIEYVGEVITTEMCQKRIQESRRHGETNFYHLTMEASLVIDAGPKGNMARFINHSCKPNLDTLKWNVNGETKVCLFSNQFIAAGTELTFNYNLDSLDSEKTACKCGEANCAGFIGGKKEKEVVKSKKKKITKTMKKKKPVVPSRKRKMVVEEKRCFRCGDEGSLIKCGMKNCSKAYHLKCTTRTEEPKGKWLCPRHFCDVCSKPALSSCSKCPNSLCKKHSENVNECWKRSTDGMFVCQEHDLI